MFLKSLSLKGFKSFADTTTLEFEPGVTVVVGPNGSGKSNVVDAVAWVLGAQGPRTLRSSKMEDVIFAGTPKRPALGRAEVSLTIDNSAGVIPIEFSEVTITRTLFRNGDSEYAINGVPCRLLDVTELLSDAGVGRQQHVIVSQGNLDAVLDARPEERRLIIEEAAGVLKYRRRKERAERRLESTEGNLLRLNDLLREVRRQLKPLQRQAEAARRREEVIAELESLRRHLAGVELEAIETRLAADQRALAALEGEEAELDQRMASLEGELASAEAGLQTVRQQSEALDLAEAVSRAEGTRARVHGLVALLGERRRSIERDLAVTMDRGVVASLEGEHARLASQLAATETEAAALVPLAEELASAEAALGAETADFEEVWGGEQAADSSGEPSAPVLDQLARTETPPPEPPRWGGPRSRRHRGGDPGPNQPRLPGFGRRADEVAAEVRGELSALRAGLEQGRSQQGVLAARLEALTQRRAGAEEERAGAARSLAEAEEAGPALAAATAQALAQRAETERSLEEAEAAARAAEVEANRWEARAEALSQALDEARARAGAERLTGVSGVVGTLLELIDLDEGYEAAFEAAAGEALAAVVVEDVEAARRSLEHLRANDHTGAVVALPEGAAGAASAGLSEGAAGAASAGLSEGAVGAASAGLPEGAAGANDSASAGLGGAALADSGRSALAGSDGGVGVDLGGLPAGGRPLRHHVRSWLPAVNRLLDGLLERAVFVDGDWTRSLDLALERPELIVVDRGGDRFVGGVWRAGAGGPGATGAALDEARERAAQARTAAVEAEEARTRSVHSLRAARQEAERASRTEEANRSKGHSASEILRRASSALQDADAELEAARAQQKELDSRLEVQVARVAELDALLPELEHAAAEEAERELAERAARSRLDDHRASVAVMRRNYEVKRASLDERRAGLTRRMSEVDERLRRNVAERDEAAKRRGELERRASVTEALAELAADRLTAVERIVASLRDARNQETELTRTATERAESLRSRHRAGAGRQIELRERRSKLELSIAEAKVRLEGLAEQIRRDLDCGFDEVRNAACPPLPDGVDAASRAAALQHEVRTMGPVNPLALQEHEELVEREAFVKGQLDDVVAARKELSKVIAAIDTEIVEVFRSAYVDVTTNFEKLFETLFPGGEGQLRLTDPDHLLETGIELDARPSGKNSRRLSLLSGGERSLVAMAYLFAVFRSRPSPFYLMDEVEAALDDVNLQRFLGLVGEFRKEAQLVIISHQKRTMEAADCLYGVSMPPGGSSRVVAEKVPVTAS